MIIVVHSLSQIDSSSFIVFLLLSLLCAALQNESLSNHAKIAVIGVFGDMALALREHFEPFVNVALLVFAVRRALTRRGCSFPHSFLFSRMRDS